MDPQPTPQAPSFAITLAWTAAVASLAAYASFHAGQKAMRAELAGRPAVAVIDVAGYAMHWREGPTDADRAHNGLAAAKTLAKKLADEGYVVLDQQAVLAAPVGTTVEMP